MPTLFKRSNGFYYTIVTDELGRRKWISTKERTKQSALKKLANVGEGREEAIPLVSLKTFYADFKGYAEQVYWHETVVVYDRAFTKFIEHCGNRMLVSISPDILIPIRPIKISWSNMGIHHDGSVILRYANGGTSVYVDMKATTSIEISEEVTDFLIVASDPISPDRPTSAQEGTYLPETFSIAQNYPNPFNPSTVIHYDLPKSAIVRLVVYDVLGWEVTTLVNEQKPGGGYDVTFNTTGLASGVYFYRLQAGEFVSVKK